MALLGFEGIDMKSLRIPLGSEVGSEVGDLIGTHDVLSEFVDLTRCKVL
jgi:hypothetical protein